MSTVEGLYDYYRDCLFWLETGVNPITSTPEQQAVFWLAKHDFDKGTECHNVDDFKRRGHKRVRVVMKLGVF